MSNFSVHSYTLLSTDDMDKYVHWSTGLKMVIINWFKNGNKKGDVTLKLSAEEIKQLVQTLPTTIRGSY